MDASEEAAVAPEAVGSGSAAAGAGGPRNDDVVYLQLKGGRRFCVSSAVLGHFPDSVLMALFPSGLVPFFPAPTPPHPLPSDPPQESPRPLESLHAPEQSSEPPLSPKVSSGSGPPGSSVVCGACHLPIFPPSTAHSASSLLCQCIRPLVPPLPPGLGRQQRTPNQSFASADHDLSRPFFDPESPLLELEMLDASKFVRSDLDPDLFAYIVSSLRWFLLENESRKRLPTRNASALSDPNSPFMERSETVSDGSLDDFEFSREGASVVQTSRTGRVDDQPADTPALASILGGALSTAGGALSESPAPASTPSHSPAPLVPNPPPVEALLVLREETEFFIIPRERKPSPLRPSSSWQALSHSNSSGPTARDMGKSNSRSAEPQGSLVPKVRGKRQLGRQSKYPSALQTDGPSEHSVEDIIKDRPQLVSDATTLQYALIRRHCSSLLANRATIGESFGRTNYSTSSFEPTHAQLVGAAIRASLERGSDSSAWASSSRPAATPAATQSASLPSPSSPLQHLHLVEAIETLSTFDRKSSSWGYRNHDGSDAKLVSMALLALRDPEETDRLIKAIEGRDQIEDPSTALQRTVAPVAAPDEAAAPPPTSSSLEKGDEKSTPIDVEIEDDEEDLEGQALITQVEMDPLMAAASGGGEEPPFSLSLLLSHMQARRPVRKCWWEHTTMRVDSAELARTYAASSSGSGPRAKFAENELFGDEMEDVEDLDDLEGGFVVVVAGRSNDAAAVDTTAALNNTATVLDAVAEDGNPVSRAGAETESDDAAAARREAAASSRCLEFGSGSTLASSRRKSDPGIGSGGRSRSRAGSTGTGSDGKKSGLQQQQQQQQQQQRGGVWRFLFRKSQSKGLTASRKTPNIGSADGTGDEDSGARPAPLLGAGSEGSMTTISTAVQSGASSDVEGPPSLQAEPVNSADNFTEVNVWVRRVWLLEFVGL